MSPNDTRPIAARPDDARWRTAEQRIAAAAADQALAETSAQDSRLAQRHSDLDQRASDIDQAAADQERASEPARTAQQLAVLASTKAMRAQATVQRAQVTADRSAAQASQSGEDRRLDEACVARDRSSDEGDWTAHFRDECTAALERGLLPDRAHQILALLPGAVERGELAVHYQPIYALGPHDVVGFEALLRWTTPTLGAVSPDEFIPVAETTGAIIPISEWVLDTALHALTAWRAASPTQHLSVAVNVAPEQLTDTFAEELHQRLADLGIPAAALTLEVTERTLVTDAPTLHAAMNELRALGVRLSVDDFGTGFSSLGRLASFPLDEIKIDQIFVSGLTDDRRHRGLIAGIVAMSAALDLRVVAEGIETAEQSDTLIELGCELGQGYLLGRPSDGAHAAALITAGAVATATQPACSAPHVIAAGQSGSVLRE